MKEKVAIFVTLLIVGLFVPIISYASSSTFTPNYIQTDDFIAYTSINAATITLANGQVISNAVVTGGSSNETQTIMNDIDIIINNRHIWFDGWNHRISEICSNTIIRKIL